MHAAPVRPRIKLAASSLLKNNSGRLFLGAASSAPVVQAPRLVDRGGVSWIRKGVRVLIDL
jgi:hypothetical protein